MKPHMHALRMRDSISAQIRAHCEAHGLECEVTNSKSGAVQYVIEGETLTPGEAADKYLPGGFAEAFGGSLPWNRA